MRSLSRSAGLNATIVLDPSPQHAPREHQHQQQEAASAYDDSSTAHLKTATAKTKESSKQVKNPQAKLCERAEPREGEAQERAQEERKAKLARPRGGQENRQRSGPTFVTARLELAEMPNLALQQGLSPCVRLAR